VAADGTQLSGGKRRQYAMHKITTFKNSLLLLGIAFFTQATTSLIGGAVFYNPFIEEGNIPATMNNIAANVSAVYAGVFLQIVTALVIVLLGVLLYRITENINKTAAVLALGFYIFEAILHTIGQAFVFSLVELSGIWTAGGDAVLINISQALMTARTFAGGIAMIPFGLGAIIFYCLLLKAKIIPKWLAIWGLVTVPFVLVGVPLTVFGVSVPFALFVPYVPWEFFTGIYILIKRTGVPIGVG
jgi:hypothetical protein